MAWDSIIGQERVKQLLKKSLEQGTVAHAYLFYGPKGVGKEALALEFSKTLICEKNTVEACGDCRSCKQFETLQHPDVQLIFPLPTGSNEKSGDNPYERLSEEQLSLIREQILLKARDYYHRIEIPKANFIKINSIRELKKQASLAHIQSRYKIFILINAEMMNAEAANSLLKTLEEPLPNTILLLTTSDRDSLLPTIVSRCQQIQCDPLTEEAIVQALVERDGCDESKARTVALLSNGSYVHARELLAEDSSAHQKEVIDFLGYAVTKQYRELIAVAEELTSWDRSEVQKWFEILQVWIREAMVIRETNKEGYPIFSSDRCKRFLERYPNAQLHEAIEAIDTAIAHLNKNVYLPLIVMTLAQDLYHSITGCKL